MSEVVEQGDTEATDQQDAVETSTLLGGESSAEVEAPEGEAAAGEESTEGEVADGEGVSEGAPESYDSFELPEGFEMDEGLLGAVVDEFKDANLTQAQAQKFVDAYAKQQQTQAEAYQAEVADTLTQNLQQVKEDPKLGGDNLVKTESNIANVFKAFETAVGSEEANSLRELMSQPVAIGIGNNVALVRMLNWVGGQMGEDSGIGGEASVPAKTPLEVLYK